MRRRLRYGLIVRALVVGLTAGGLPALLGLPAQAAGQAPADPASGSMAQLPPPPPSDEDSPPPELPAQDAMRAPASPPGLAYEQQQAAGQSGSVGINQGGPGSPGGPSSLYVDMGDPRSEARFNPENWANVPDGNPFESPSGDRTKRFLKQPGDGDAFLTFAPVTPDQDYRLTAEVEDGECDDSFQILIGNAVLSRNFLLYGYVADSSRGTFIREHVVPIPGPAVTTWSVRISFHNMTHEDCGHVGVYNIRLTW